MVRVQVGDEDAAHFVQGQSGLFEAAADSGAGVDQVEVSVGQNDGGGDAGKVPRATMWGPVWCVVMSHLLAGYCHQFG